MRFRIALAALFLLAVSSSVQAQRAIVLVRHAEKVDESKDAALSAAGQARAARLAELLSQTGVTSIFVTEYARTKSTAQPLAQRLGLGPTVISTNARDELRKKLAALSQNDVALVVGHSDTLPLLIRELGVKDPIEIASADYGNLFIVIPQRTSPPTLLRLRF